MSLHRSRCSDGRYFLILNRGPDNNAEGSEVAVVDAKTKAYYD